MSDAMRFTSGDVNLGLLVVSLVFGLTFGLGVPTLNAQDMQNLTDPFRVQGF